MQSPRHGATSHRRLARPAGRAKWELNSIKTLQYCAVRDFAAEPATVGIATVHFLDMPTPDDFIAIDLRVGTVLRAEPFPEARKPSIRLEIDFGPLGIRRSSAQLTRRYTPEALLGRQVVAVVNIGERRVAGFTSQVLVLGGVPEEGDVVLLSADAPVPNGTRIA